MFQLSEFFTDPILRAPTIGSMLMAISSALIGAIVFVRKRSLIGETLSHATYPGVVLAVLVAELFFPLTDNIVNASALIGGFISAVLGLFLVEKIRAPKDAALCFTLALFLGMGVLFASRLQLGGAMWYRQIQSYLYGQVATMTNTYITVYAALTGLVILAVVALFQRFKLCYFDASYARAIGASTPMFRILVHVLLILSIVIGIRSVGIVMISGMLIAPAVAARQWTNRLGTLFCLAAAFGCTSAFFGNYFSAQLPRWMGESVSLATGPMIILTAVLFALLSLLVAPKRGVISRAIRAHRFQKKCATENLLKNLWKHARDQAILPADHPLGKFLPYLHRAGYVAKQGGAYKLTIDGKKRAARIVRIHRLWEAYLDRMGLTGDHVHRSASEMEHIITPEIEDRLSSLLGHPTTDPHNQPIPQKGEY